MLLSAAVKVSRLIGVVLAVLLSVAARDAFAARDSEVIPVEKGFIELRGGVRLTPQGTFEKMLADRGYKLHSTLVTPAVIFPLGYRVNRDWSAALEFGYGAGQYELVDSAGVASAVRSSTFTIQIVGQWVPPVEWGRLEPVFGIGGGYYLSTIKNADRRIDGANTEANATGAFVSAGLRWAATRNIGLSIEDRYAFAVAGVGNLGRLNVGGNTASLGLYYVWR